MEKILAGQLIKGVAEATGIPPTTVEARWRALREASLADPDEPLVEIGGKGRSAPGMSKESWLNLIFAAYGASAMSSAATQARLLRSARKRDAKSVGDVGSHQFMHAADFTNAFVGLLEAEYRGDLHKPDLQRDVAVRFLADKGTAEIILLYRDEAGDAKASFWALYSVRPKREALAFATGGGLETKLTHAGLKKKAMMDLMNAFLDAGESQ